MKNYAYRSDITGDALYQQHAQIRAAYALAKRAHEGQSRRKIDPTIPYLVHPVMAYDLMIGMGVTDPDVLAATLLHDAQEDYGPYKQNVLLLERELKAELRKEWHSGADLLAASHAASSISALVQQVTNVPVPKESKGIAQMRRAESISQGARLIKIADQTTNLICNLMMENSAAFSPFKTVGFAQKARDLVVAITANPNTTAPERAELMRWKKLFRNVFTFNAELLEAKTPQLRLRVRERFAAQMEHIVPALGELDAAAEPHRVEHHVYFSKHQPTEADIKRYGEDGLFGLPEFGGITRVDLNDEGDVVGFLTWANPEEGPKEHRNQMQEALVGFLRLSGHDVVIEPALQELEVQNKKLLQGRYHRMEAPMDAKEFAVNAVHADCMNRFTDMARLVSKARDMKLDFVMPEPGGTSR